MTARDTHASRRPFNASIDWTYVFHDSAGGLMVVMSAELLKAACAAGGWRLTQGAEPMTGIDRLPAHQNRGFAVGDAREVLGTLPAATFALPQPVPAEPAPTWSSTPSPARVQDWQ
jgi:hypothetical protein